MKSEKKIIIPVIVILFLLIVFFYSVMSGHINLPLPLILLLIFVVPPLAIVALFVFAVNSKPDKQGKELLESLRTGHYDVEKIFGEMKFIAEVNLSLYDELNYLSKQAKGSSIDALSSLSRRWSLPFKLNENLLAEWNPRYKFLSEISNSFDRQSNEYVTFIEFSKINYQMQKTSLWRNYFDAIGEVGSLTVKRALKAGAIAGITTIAVAGVVGSMLHNAGKDIGNYPKSNLPSGPLYDGNGNRVYP